MGFDPRHDAMPLSPDIPGGILHTGPVDHYEYCRVRKDAYIAALEAHRKQARADIVEEDKRKEEAWIRFLKRTYAQG